MEGCLQASLTYLPERSFRASPGGNLLEFPQPRSCDRGALVSSSLPSRLSLGGYLAPPVTFAKAEGILVWKGKSGGLVVLLLAEQRRGWSLMIFCARATRGLRRPSLDARSRRSISPHPWRENERAWREHLYRSTRAVEDQSGQSLKTRKVSISCPRGQIPPLAEL